MTLRTKGIFKGVDLVAGGLAGASVFCWINSYKYRCSSLVMTTYLNAGLKVLAFAAGEVTALGVACLVQANRTTAKELLAELKQKMAANASVEPESGDEDDTDGEA